MVAWDAQRKRERNFFPDRTQQREEQKLTSPEVGSSKNSIFGLAISSSPMFTRFFSPPETPRLFTSPTRLLATRDSPKLASVSSAKSPITLAGVPFGSLNLPLKIKFSLTVNSA
jgi:hypothetical protein